MTLDTAPFLATWVSIDLEVDPKSARIFAFAAVRGEAVLVHKGSVLSYAKHCLTERELIPVFDLFSVETVVGATLAANVDSGRADTVTQFTRAADQICIDPVKICSCDKGEGSDECDDGRQHQTVDGEA